MHVKQCSVLFIDPRKEPSDHRLALKRAGLAVTVISAWPDDRALLDANVVIVVVEVGQAAMVAARLRARAGFGRRLLIGLVTSVVSASDRRSAIASGFDDVVAEVSAPRELTTRVLRRLRADPENPCDLPREKPRDKKRSAA
jgi:hypothetical protein